MENQGRAEHLRSRWEGRGHPLLSWETWATLPLGEELPGWRESDCWGPGPPGPLALAGLPGAPEGSTE